MSGEDLKKEIGHLEKAMFKAFVKDGEAPIYDPERFFDFCKHANADNLFNFILSTISLTATLKTAKNLIRSTQ